MTTELHLSSLNERKEDLVKIKEKHLEKVQSLDEAIKALSDFIDAANGLRDFQSLINGRSEATKDDNHLPDDNYKTTPITNMDKVERGELTVHEALVNHGAEMDKKVVKALLSLRNNQTKLKDIRKSSILSQPKIGVLTWKKLLWFMGKDLPESDYMDLNGALRSKKILCDNFDEILDMVIDGCTINQAYKKFKITEYHYCQIVTEQQYNILTDAMYNR